jgi:Sulfotransferase family
VTDRTPFPFVVGSERSGTTLLRLMLDAHPLMAVPPESYFIVDLARRHGRARAGVDPAAVARDLEANRWFRQWGMAPDDLRAALGTGRMGLADAVRRVYGRYAQAQGKPRYGDKTPAYVQHVRLLAGVLPESRFVHLIRDGRDVALSLSEVRWGPRDLLDAALHWRERVARGREAGQEVGAHRYLEVRYERLVADPEPVLREVAELCELPFDDAMLRHQETAADRLPGRPDGLHRRAATAPSGEGRDWRRDMAPEDLAAVELLLGDLLDQLGYERGAGRASAEARDRARRAAARRRRRHLVRRAKFYLRGGRRA